MTSEYSYKEDRQKVVNRHINKIKELAVFKDATREECLESIVYEMAAKIDSLQLTLDITHKEI